MEHDTYSLAKHDMAGHDEKPAKEIHHISTRKSKNGGHVHEHHFTHPAHPMEEHTTQGDDAMADHMMQNMGTPNPGEAEADAGQSGIPTAAAGAVQAPPSPMGA